jgi:hypothetical protein
MEHVQRSERSSSAGIPELDQIVLTPRYEQAHRWAPLDALDVPSVAGKDALLSALRERPDPHSRVVTGGGESFIVR